MMNYISQEGWKKFQDNYSGAYAFLLHESLKGECNHLRRISSRSDWQEERLAELEAMFAEYFPGTLGEPVVDGLDNLVDLLGSGSLTQSRQTPTRFHIKGEVLET